MKKVLYALGIVILPLQLFAQPVINNMEANPIGMVAQFLVCDTNITAGGSGASQTWTMSSMVRLGGTQNDTLYEYTVANPSGSPAPSATRMDSFISYTNAPGGNKYIEQTSGATYLPYWLIFSGDYFQYTSPANGLLIAKQPFHYNDTYTDTFNYTGYSAAPPIPVSGYYTVNADAYGTLILPNATYNNVLRINVSEIDTLHDAGGPHIGTTNSYVWYDNYHSEPLCKISTSVYTSGSSKTCYYMLSQTPLVKVENVANKQIAFSACFNSGKLLVNSDFQQGSSYQLSVFNLAGQQVYNSSFTASGANAQFNIDKWLCPGIYIVTLSDTRTGSFGSIKTLKQL